MNTFRLYQSQTRNLPIRTPWRAFADWFLWAFVLRNHRFARINCDGMGCSRDELQGRITRLWTAPYSTKDMQAGYTYAVIRYEDGREDREAAITGSSWPRRHWFLYFNEEMQRYERTR